MYERYRIATNRAPLSNGFPGRFAVERRETCINCGQCVDACVYGVHLKEEGDPRLMATPGSLLCVGCMRCVMECPVGVLDVGIHPDFQAMGDGYVRPRIVETIWEEAEAGNIPVSGAGYRGPFVQPGFDAIWTDMSEIVRPTRDGIHGREYISTAVDLGRKPPYVEADDGWDRPLLEIPLPFLFNPPTGVGTAPEQLLADAATLIGTYAVVDANKATALRDRRVIPRLPLQGAPSAKAVAGFPAVEWDASLQPPEDLTPLREAAPEAVHILRMPLRRDRGELYAKLIRQGVDVLHLYADPHGREVGVEEPDFIAPVLRDLDQELVEAGLRDEVTLVASGGIVASEHIPKALLCGADAVALDTTLLIALGWNASPQADLPGILDAHWAVQRILNWANACRDQLLEIMGAMGIRDARRLAGEIGRTMWHEDLEAEFEALFAGGASDG